MNIWYSIHNFVFKRSNKEALPFVESAEPVVEEKPQGELRVSLLEDVVSPISAAVSGKGEKLSSRHELEMEIKDPKRSGTMLPTKAATKEVTNASLVIIARAIDENPDNYKKSCEMTSETGKCDGSESSNPFETTPFKVRNFIINIFDLKHPKNPEIPIVRITKKGEEIELVEYKWDGQEYSRSTFKENDPNATMLIGFIRNLDKVKIK